MFSWVAKPPKPAFNELIAQVIAWAQISRKEGLLALEAKTQQIREPFTRKALQMLIDGVEPDRIRDVLEVDIVSWERELKTSAKIWEAAAGYSPTIGILGAVMGLIHVMENLSDPGRLGAGIAVAFVATIYGVGAANLIFLPTAKRLILQIGQLVSARELLVDGIVCIGHGENPRLIETRLRGYVQE